MQEIEGEVIKIEIEMEDIETGEKRIIQKNIEDVEFDENGILILKEEDWREING